jgi:hypothetical protein
MATALECPRCGARHRLARVAPGLVFRCERCGQKLLVPGSDVARSPPASRATDSEPRRGVAWYCRPLAWTVALPVGLVISVWASYASRLLTKDELLGAFVGSGLGRYSRLAAATAMWAFISALLVQAFTETGRWWAGRRRRRRTGARAAARRRSVVLEDGVVGEVGEE